MFYILTTYLPDKLELFAAFENLFSCLISYVFYNVGAETFNTPLLNYVFLLFYIINDYNL